MALRNGPPSNAIGAADSSSSRSSAMMVLGVRGWDHADKRAIHLARTQDEKEHAIETAILNFSRGTIFRDELRDNPSADIVSMMFSDGGAEYRTRTERLRLAAQRPRGELTPSAVEVMNKVFADIELVQCILEQCEGHHDRKRLVASVSKVWAIAAATHSAWAVMSNVTFPKYVTCSGETLYFAQDLLEVHASQNTAVTAAATRNADMAAEGKGILDEDGECANWEVGCGCGAQPMKLHWAIRQGDTLFFVVPLMIDGLMIELSPTDRHLFRTRAEAELFRQSILESWRTGPMAYMARNWAGGAARHPERLGIKEFQCFTPGA
jgi:hypothetical protein